MDLLSISPSHPSPSLRTLSPNPKNPMSSFAPKPSLSLSRFSKPIRTTTRCVFTASPIPSKNPNFGSESRNPNLTFHLSSPQTPATAARGAEGDVMGLLLRERIVFLGSSIDDFVADAVMSQLLLLDAQDPTKDIRLFINSTGGSLRNAGIFKDIIVSTPLITEEWLWYIYKEKGPPFCATMAIYDAVQLVRADVSTVALGIAASTASVILGGGTKGKRFAMPNTRIMIHQPLGGASGQAIDVEIQAKEVMHNKNNITRIISSFTGRSFEQVQKDIDRDKYMSPIEAVEYGIIDGVIDRDRIIPLMPVPERVKSTLNYEEISKDPRKFLNPEIPDDEIY